MSISIQIRTLSKRGQPRKWPSPVRKTGYIRRILTKYYFFHLTQLLEREADVSASNRDSNASLQSGAVFGIVSAGDPQARHIGETELWKKLEELQKKFKD